MPDDSLLGAIPEPDHASAEAMSLELGRAYAELAARDKTIRVLIARVEGQFGRRDSAVAVLEQNISLEQKVHRRTRELEESHESLSRTLHELKLAQGQLLHANKLEAIGQLAAGVAHEVNTPIQYVADNASFLKGAFQKLTTALDDTLLAVREMGMEAALRARLEQLEARLKMHRLSWLREQIPRALEQSLEGLERVSSIVGAMKEFSHPGAAEKQLVDVHDAIRATITVARHEWKYVADVQTQFAGNVPHVPCLRNEFNQVILNLIVNAAHAIAERLGEGGGAKGTITVTTELVLDHVEIRIADDGAGIPPAVGARIYEPFFTTKPVGKGTGQGLAIARSVIVGKHGGTMHFETEVGQGTCFILRLPLQATTAGEGVRSHPDRAGPAPTEAPAIMSNVDRAVV